MSSVVEKILQRYDNSTSFGLGVSGQDSSVMKLSEYLQGNDESASHPLDVLDTDSDGTVIDSVKELDVKYVAVEPIRILDVQDSSGRIKDLVESLEYETGLSVIPFKMAKLSPHVNSIKDHDIKHLRHKNYSFSKTIRQNVIDEYKQKIIDKLSNGIPFKENLWVVVEYEKALYKTLKLSEVEWTYLCSLFRECNAKIFTTDDDDFILSIDNCVEEE